MFYVPDVLAEWEMACRMQHGMQALSFLQEKGKKLWRVNSRFRITNSTNLNYHICSHHVSWPVRIPLFQSQWNTVRNDREIMRLICTCICPSWNIRPTRNMANYLLGIPCLVAVIVVIFQHQ